MKIKCLGGKTEKLFAKNVVKLYQHPTLPVIKQDAMKKEEELKRKYEKRIIKREDEIKRGKDIKI